MLYKTLHIQAVVVVFFKLINKWELGDFHCSNKKAIIVVSVPLRIREQWILSRLYGHTTSYGRGGRHGGTSTGMQWCRNQHGLLLG